MFLGLNRNITLLIACALIPIAIIYQLIKTKQDNNNLLSEINNKLDMIIRGNVTAEKIQSMIDESKNETLKEVRKMISDSVYILEHKKAIFFLERSSGKIKISQKSKDGNQYACGTLMKYNDTFYFVTNRHVVFDNYTNTVRDIDEIILYDDSILNFTSTIIIFKDKRLPDIALIVVLPTKRQAENACTPTYYQNYLGQELITKYVQFLKNAKLLKF